MFSILRSQANGPTGAMDLAYSLEITLGKLMRKTHMQAAPLSLLVGLAVCLWFTQVGLAQNRPSVLRPSAQPSPQIQSPVKESGLVRKELPATANQWLSLRQTLAVN